MKKIKEGEPFEINGKAMVYSVKEGRVVLSYYSGWKRSNSFQPPTKSAVVQYFTENGYSPDSANKFFDYYSAAEWKDGKGNQVKNWKQKAIGVWFKEENKIKTIKDSGMVR